MSAGHDDGENLGQGPSRDWSFVSLGLGLLALTWAVLILLPSVGSLPAWPAASVGVFAIALSRLPGRPLLRGVGAFFGFVGVVVGAVKIAALWGLLELLGR